MKLRRPASVPASDRAIRPRLERLGDRRLLSVDFNLAFPIGGASHNTSAGAPAVDADGALYLGGQITGTTEFGGTGPSHRLTPPGGSEGYVAKYTPAGKLIWVLEARPTPNMSGGGTIPLLFSEVTAVTLDSAGNAYVAGGYGGTLTLGSFTLKSPVFAGFVTKVDSAGNVLWAKTLDSDASLMPNGIAVDGSSDVYVSGSFRGTAFGGTIASSGLADAFLVRLLPNGNRNWASAFGGTQDDEADGVAVDGAGTAYLTGFFRGSGGFGSFTLTSAGGSDAFAAKVNSAGSVLWAKGIGGPRSDVGTGVGVDGGGNVFVAGAGQGMITFGPGLKVDAGTQSAYVAKFNGLGDTIWARILVSAGGTSTAERLAVDRVGNVYSSGFASGTVEFDPGPGSYPIDLGAASTGFVWKLDGLGRFEFERNLLGTGASSSNVALGPKGKILLVGTYRGPTQAGPLALPDVAGPSHDTAFLSALVPPVANDFDGDGKADLAVLRPSTYQWFIARSGGMGGQVVQLGGSGDVPVPGDYLGTGATQVAVYRPSTATWYSPAFGAIQFGAPGDIPVPGDYGGDGKTDLAVFRPSTGTWFVRRSTLGALSQGFGAPGDIPVPADYDGDGKTDIAVYRPGNATWFILGSTVGPYFQQFGAPGLDLPVPGDYTATGHAQLAIYRPETALWAVQGVGRILFGPLTGALPVPADYAGAGFTQLAVFTSAMAQWSTFGSSPIPFGQPRLDIPIELPLVYRGTFFGKAAARALSLSSTVHDTIDPPKSVLLTMVDAGDPAISALQPLELETEGFVPTRRAHTSVVCPLRLPTENGRAIVYGRDFSNSAGLR